jgi:hypothetical protein
LGERLGEVGFEVRGGQAEFGPKEGAGKSHMVQP